MESNSMNVQSCVSSKPKSTMVFSCSGAADVGAISDQTARRMAKENLASMCCTAAVAAEIPEILGKVREIETILVIDGCSKNCAKNILNQAGFTNINHFQLEALGMEKGKSPVTEDTVDMLYNLAKEYLKE
jgi:uncharacterized metal-binding protein